MSDTRRKVDSLLERQIQFALSAFLGFDGVCMVFLVGSLLDCVAMAAAQHSGLNGSADGAALSAVQSGRCKASGFGRGGVAGCFWPTVPRRLLLRFDLSFQSWDGFNSDSKSAK